ncbi:TetR/AcrR family transcriptional regulator [Oceanobacillus polygoni]|uniref:AcrR family transcriptional regulator n=1 Tax=Oceanobacillus polygoni TaxID=1235259 RepID=A0A9X0YRV6_9BACI|nr:TetR/AcrR family transcriptional regulator [Oceanobacillus polygoni]MBP2076897.1 AcrR family transcriptional regulator [Oceanobacillus polygoni]
MQKKLIDAALHQYALHGYHGATMRKIATEVGIKPASIYFFYQNKEELFIAAFKQLLDNHFRKMESILDENRDKPVEQIFSAMIQGIVSHHKGDIQGTDAYISLVTSPIPEITKYLNDHMMRYNDWLGHSLGSILKNSYPMMTQDETARVIKQFVLIGNGVFWGIKLYHDDDFEEQVVLADDIIHSLFDKLNKKYLNVEAPNNRVN